jgi:hypothetical protein
MIINVAGELRLRQVPLSSACCALGGRNFSSAASATSWSLDGKLLVVKQHSNGREYEREIEAPDNASLLCYLGPELDFSTPNLKNLVFVLKLQHRSGSKDVSFLPTLGNMAGAITHSLSILNASI